MNEKQFKNDLLTIEVQSHVSKNKNLGLNGDVYFSFYVIYEISLIQKQFVMTFVINSVRSQREMTVISHEKALKEREREWERNQREHKKEEEEVQ